MSRLSLGLVLLEPATRSGVPTRAGVPCPVIQTEADHADRACLLPGQHAQATLCGALQACLLHMVGNSDWLLWRRCVVRPYNVALLGTMATTD